MGIQNRQKMGIQNRPKSRPKIDRNGDPKINQNGDPKIDRNGDPKSGPKMTQHFYFFFDFLGSFTKKANSRTPMSEKMRIIFLILSPTNAS